METVNVNGTEYYRDEFGRLIPAKEEKTVNISFEGSSRTITLKEWLFLVSLLDLISDQTDLLFGTDEAKVFLSPFGESLVYDLWSKFSGLSPLGEWIDGTFSISDVWNEVSRDYWIDFERVRNKPAQ